MCSYIMLYESGGIWDKHLSQGWAPYISFEGLSFFVLNVHRQVGIDVCVTLINNRCILLGNRNPLTITNQLHSRRYSVNYTKADSTTLGAGRTSVQG